MEQKDIIEPRECYFKTFQEILTIGGNTEGPLTVIGSGEIVDLIFDRIKVQNVNFQHSIILKRIQFNNDVVFKDCHFKSKTQFIDVKFNTIVIFENCTGVESIEFVNCNYDDFQFSSGTYKNIRFLGTNGESRIGINHLKFDNSTIQSLELKCKDIYSSIEFNGGNIDDLFIGRTQLHGFVLFNNTFNCKSFTTEANAFKGRLDFYESSFGNIYFRKK